MSIKAEIQSLSPSAIVEMFVLDLTSATDGGISRFHAGTNKLNQPLVWQGETYYPLPIEAEGFDMSAKGVLPKPKIRVANINGLFSAEIRENDDLINCKVIRKRTFARFLDAVNFPDGINIDADPNQYLPDDTWFIDRKVSENKYLIEWELASAFDVQGVMLPLRQVIQNSCPWTYRSAECGYLGTKCYDKYDNLTDDESEDYCAKKLSSCQVRYRTLITPFNLTPLSFGGFPGAFRNG